MGGRNDEAACNLLYTFCTQTHTWARPEVTGDIPGQRDGHSACVIGDFMYVFGGYEENIERFGHALIRVGERLFLFGGTSPYTGPQLYFTPEQLSLLPQQEEDTSSQLMDHDDLHVLDMNPSLKTLTLVSIIQNKISTEGLPRTLLTEISNMTQNNSISRPLITVASLPTG